MILHNIQSVLDYNKRYSQTHPDRVIIWNKKRAKKRSRDVKYILNKNLATRMAQTLVRGKNGVSWEKLLGYTTSDLIKHLSKQFTDDMTWDNYGTYWQIDHIIPLSVFNYAAVDDLDFLRAWDLKNLQPLPAKVNASKCAKLSKPFQPSLKLKAACGE